MRPFLLVHGAWHGGWCWRRVAPLLRARGHDVFTPTLTGLGERSHLLSPLIDLDTHIQDIVQVLFYEDLTDVVLVGHSYGGVVITGVAEQAATCLTHLVYLDAFIPQDGQAHLDLLPPDRRAFFQEQAREQGEGWRVPSLSLAAFGVTDEADRTWVEARLTPQPLATFQQPIRLVEPVASALPRMYIHCTGNTSGTFAPFAERARSTPGWRYEELATGHDAMLTDPQGLADLLLTLVE
jgi:pimeloyl-ACP methyl ester carboxylesterase